MAISAVDPISPAIERTRQILFRPFQAGKWFVLGFCSWIAYLGSSSGGGGPPASFPGGAGPGGGAQAPGKAPAAPGLPPELRHAIEWVQANLLLVVGVSAAVITLIIVIGLLISWLQSRFSFIFLDNVVRNRAEVADPWREFRREGDSLFGFRVVLMLGSWLVFLALVAATVAIAWPDVQAQHFGAWAIGAIVFGILAVVAVALVLTVIHVFIDDFVIPIMYLRRQGAMASWSEFRHNVLAGHWGAFLLYLLFRVVVVSLVIGCIAVGVTCATCCLALLPYIGSVILLPLTVFMRQYSLYYLEQFGPSWQFFARGKPATSDLDFLEA
jgi:hypothetical protein